MIEYRILPEMGLISSRTVMGFMFIIKQII